MKNHTKVYMDYFGFDKDDFIPCEITGQKATDIHHIDPRGMGGVGTKNDYIENLVALTREMHDLAEANKIPREAIQMAHDHYLKAYEMCKKSGKGDKGRVSNMMTEIGLKLHIAHVKTRMAELGLHELIYKTKSKWTGSKNT